MLFVLIILSVYTLILRIVHLNCKQLWFIWLLIGGGAFSNCHSKYGAFEKTEFMEQVQLYARDHIQKSFQFLLMVSNECIL